MLTSQEDAGEINVHHALPVFEPGFVDRAVTENTRIIHQYIKASKTRDDFINGIDPAALCGDVLGKELSAESFGNGFTLWVDVSDYCQRTFFDEALRDACTETRSTSRHDGDFVIQSSHFSSFKSGASLLAIY